MKSICRVWYYPTRDIIVIENEEYSTIEHFYFEKIDIGDFVNTAVNLGEL